MKRLSGQAIEYVANLLDMAPIRVHEVATFYTMFNLKPVGRHFIQVCRTTPCWLRGADEITKTCLAKTGASRLKEMTEDGLFTVVEVECALMAAGPTYGKGSFWFVVRSTSRLRR